MKKRLLCVSMILILAGCTASTSETADQNNHYEYRIVEDPSTRMLTVFYEKDGNLYYRQISQAYQNGDNITLMDGGWTEMKPPGDSESFRRYQ